MSQIKYFDFYRLLLLSTKSASIVNRKDKQVLRTSIGHHSFLSQRQLPECRLASNQALLVLHNLYTSTILFCQRPLTYMSDFHARLGCYLADKNTSAGMLLHLSQSSSNFIFNCLKANLFIYVEVLPNNNVIPQSS